MHSFVPCAHSLLLRTGTGRDGTTEAVFFMRNIAARCYCRVSLGLLKLAERDCTEIGALVSCAERTLPRAPCQSRIGCEMYTHPILKLKCAHSLRVAWPREHCHQCHRHLYRVKTLVCYMVGLPLIRVFHHGVLQLLCQFGQISTYPKRQCNDQNKVCRTDATVTCGRAKRKGRKSE